MATSQNGWPVIDSGSDSRLQTFPPVTGKVLAGDVFDIFTDLAAKFSAQVEPIDQAQSWGYANRTISGSKTISNHASGTAVDFNASKHPQGKSTFSDAQKAVIRGIVGAYGGAIRWGGDYTTGKIDEMHFEINQGSSQVTAVAAQVRGGSAPAPAPAPAPDPSPAGHNASDGQETLLEDGDLGPRTISRWQQVMGTPIDGTISKPKSTLIEADQAFLNTAVAPGHIMDLTGQSSLRVDGDNGKLTIKVRQFYLFNTQAPAVLGRGATTADFDGIQGPTTTKLLQHALNLATAATGRY